MLNLPGRLIGVRITRAQEELRLKGCVKIEGDRPLYHLCGVVVGQHLLRIGSFDPRLQIGGFFHQVNQVGRGHRPLVDEVQRTDFRPADEPWHGVGAERIGAEGVFEEVVESVAIRVGEFAGDGRVVRIGAESLRGPGVYGENTGEREGVEMRANRNNASAYKCTATGARRVVAVPSPSWPPRLLPQPKSCPSEVRAKLWATPAVSAVTDLPASTPLIVTATGT